MLEGARQIWKRLESYEIYHLYVALYKLCAATTISHF